MTMKLARMCAVFVGIMAVEPLYSQESIIGQIDYAYVEKLVELAKEHQPRRKIAEAGAAKTKAVVSATQVSYLDAVSLSYFYRPRERASLNPENPFVVTGFQLGVTVSPGLFFQKPFQVKQAKADYLVADLELKDYDRQLALEVKSRYYTYLQLKNDLAVKAQAVQDSRILVEDVRGRFERGEVELADYSDAKALNSVSISSHMEAEVGFLKAKDALEEIIGVPIDQVQ
jgi:outer membrane protein TolC